MNHEYSESDAEKARQIIKTDDEYWLGYFHYIAMNELMLSESIGKSKQVLDVFNVLIDFDVENYYLCLTGLKKQIYIPVYGLTPRKYVDVFVSMKPDLLAELERNNYNANLFLESCNDTRQIAILFSPSSEACISPREMACRISETVEVLNDKLLFKGRRGHSSFTALSDRLSGLQSLREGFFKTSELSEYSFFYTNPVVFTRADIEKLRKTVDYEMVMASCKDFKLALADGKEKECKNSLDVMFGLLKDSLNLSLSRSVLAYLENALQVFCTVYDAGGCVDPEKLCDIGEYYYLDECRSAFLTAAELLCAKARERGRYSDMAQSAIYFIKNHYMKDISLTDIARYADINPSYLSGQFKREVGASLSEYIMKTRIEKAKLLLAQSEKRVYQIAEDVGFRDIKYFEKTFKKAVLMSPNEYRESMRNPEHVTKTKGGKRHIHFKDKGEAEDDGPAKNRETDRAEKGNP